MHNKNRYIVAALVLAAVISLIAGAAALYRADRAKAPAGTEAVSLLSCLPPPLQDDPYLIVHSTRRQFPSALTRLFIGDADTDGAAGSPCAAFIPMLDRADEACLVATLRDGALVVYGIFSLSERELASLTSLSPPARWRAALPGLVMERVGGASLRCQIVANDLPSPVFIEIDRELKAASMADSLADLDRISLTKGDRARGIQDRWRGGLDGYAKLNDGGMISSLIEGDAPSDRDSSLGVEIRWRALEAPDDRRLSDTSPSGEAEWRAIGLRGVVGAEFLNSLEPVAWDLGEIFAPDPLIASIGLDLPDPGRSISSLPAPLRFAADQMSRMRLKSAEIRDIMTGPTVLSLGGRTQVLWFDLPGAALDMRGRGSAADTLVERFWETYFGSAQRGVDGFERGGAVDLPFSATAASTRGRAIMGLIDPGAETDRDLPEMLRAASERDGRMIGWLFVDVPKVGGALREIPTVSALLDGDEVPFADEHLDRASRIMETLGRVFISWKDKDSGRALWYD